MELFQETPSPIAVFSKMPSANIMGSFKSRLFPLHDRGGQTLPSYPHNARVTAFQLILEYFLLKLLSPRPRNPKGPKADLVARIFNVFFFILNGLQQTCRKIM